ncbi:uncharacterized protein ColSpa_08011 [Colletotrichum spaethianum]|uniref:Uncharacterized protein n=1 Tax=Colletotrichum spaethianum TaxID=700344 RepID=A0AA37P8Y7_9PEZI|nr:uncharacterized protein ColSpa_08011 [Colletotrichum spaethianum]GKT47830.1 hypothetical protein ColSpa_08011 [Colletotrichum spaethianum]
MLTYCVSISAAKGCAERADTVASASLDQDAGGIGSSNGIADKDPAADRGGLLVVTDKNSV